MPITPRDLGLPLHFRSFRPEVRQLETSFQVAEALDRKRIVVVQAGTGAGKSVIHQTVSNLLSTPTWTLTPTRQLQDQIATDFAAIGMVPVQGHANYDCGDKYSRRGEVVCRRPGDCTYQQALVSARGSGKGVGNYAHWLTVARYGDPEQTFGKPGLLICDEGHKAEEWLTKACTVTLRRDELWDLLSVNLPDTLDIAQWSEWALHTLRRCETEISTLRRQSGRSTWDRDKARELQHLQALSTDLRDLSNVAHATTPWTVSGRGNDEVSLCPVWPKDNTERLLFRGIDKILFTSATIMPDTLRDLGVDESDMEYIENGSSFPANRRPFYVYPTVEVSWRMQHAQKVMLASRVGMLAEQRPARRILILTPSYDLAEWIHWELRKRADLVGRLILQEKGQGRSALDQYIDTPHSILTSPSFWEGVDLKDELCRTLIMPKVPIADARDPLTKARQESDNTYIYRLAGLKVLQGYGRPMRRTLDWAETFMLDKAWTRWFSRLPTWPGYFRLAWRRVDSAPIPLDF